MSSPSITRTLSVAFSAAVLGCAVAIGMTGGLAALWMLVHQDDETAMAMASTLGSELEGHRGETYSMLDELIVHELDEQQWFARRTEIWIESRRIGGLDDGAVMSRWRRASTGCETARIEGALERICVVYRPGVARIVVGSPLAPVLSRVFGIASVMLLVTLLVGGLGALLGRRLVRRRLEPLSRLERELTAMPAGASERRVAAAWGAAEIDSLAHSFNGLLTRIDEAVAREQRFVADAAHELRTPLTRLSLQLALASAESAERRDVSTHVAGASRTASELVRTTEALLALARSEVALDEAVDLVEVARACLADDQAWSDDRLTLHADDVQILVRGDETLLGLAVRNLIENAEKYSTARVDVFVRATDGLAEIEVLDRGEGIPDVELERVREPFVRGSRVSSAVRGVGLGLSLVDHVAQLHGGALTIANRAEGGLRALVRIPVWTSLREGDAGVVERAAT